MYTVVAERFDDGIVSGEIAYQGVKLIGWDKGELADPMHFASVE